MFYEPHDHGLPHNPFKSLIVPRPIGWISTVSTEGIVNLAPYSFFNGAADSPPILMFCAAHRPGNTMRKDSRVNAEETGEFVFNMASDALRAQMSASSAHVAPEVDELAEAGLTPAPCRIVKPPRVGESPIAMECKYLKTVHLPSDDPENENVVVFGQVVGIHISDDIIGDDGLVDTLRFKPLARLGYWQYTVVENVFTMVPPD